jgi:short-subunit dehydrogenase
VTTQTDPTRVLITGATGGIGQALARYYAEAGHSLLLHGRDPDRLESLAQRCREHGAEVQTLCVDLARADQLAPWRASLAALPPPDLVIVNAGVTSNIGADGAGESWDAIDRTLQVNQIAAMATVDALLPAMRRRGSGQIVLISSLSAWYGLPLTPAYCASKAAIKAYGEALRGWLAPEGVQVNVVLPGFVDTGMSARFPGPRPFMWSPDKAARYIARGLARNPVRISFPFPLNLGMWGLALLPAGLSQRLLQWLGYGR